MKLTRQELFAAIGYALFQKLFLPSLILTGCSVLGIRSNSVANLLFYTANFLGWGWIFRRLLKFSFQNREKVLSTALVGIPAYYLCAIAMGWLILFLDPEFSNANDANVGSMILDFPPLAFAIIVMVPVAEECFYRGLLFVPFLEKRPWLGYLLSSALFAAAHVTGYLRVLDSKALVLSFLQYIPAGLVLCWACKRSGSMLANIVIHAFVNSMGVALLR